MFLTKILGLLTGGQPDDHRPVRTQSQLSSQRKTMIGPEPITFSERLHYDYLQKLRGVDKNLYYEALQEFHKRQGKRSIGPQDVRFSRNMDTTYLNRLRQIDEDLYRQAVQEWDRRRSLTTEELDLEFIGAFSHLTDEAERHRDQEFLLAFHGQLHPLALEMVRKNQGFRVFDGMFVPASAAVELSDQGNSMLQYAFPVIKHLERGNADRLRAELRRMIFENYRSVLTPFQNSHQSPSLDLEVLYRQVNPHAREMIQLRDQHIWQAIKSVNDLIGQGKYGEAAIITLSLEYIDPFNNHLLSFKSNPNIIKALHNQILANGQRIEPNYNYSYFSINRDSKATRLADKIEFTIKGYMFIHAHGHDGEGVKFIPKADFFLRPNFNYYDGEQKKECESQGDPAAAKYYWAYRELIALNMQNWSSSQSFGKLGVEY